MQIDQRTKQSSAEPSIDVYPYDSGSTEFGETPKGIAAGALSNEEILMSWRADKAAVAVSTVDFNYSKHFVYSEGFSRCQALIMLDTRTGVAALGHFNPQTNPEYLLEGHTYGPFGGFNKNVPIAREVFEDPSRVLLAHVYGIAHSFPEVWVDTALRRQGFIQTINHLKVESTCWRHIGISPITGEITILRSDQKFPLAVQI